MKWAVSVFYLCVLASITLSAQNKPIGVLTGSDYASASVGLQVLDLATGKSLSTLNEAQMLVPASVIKLVTTATALEILGPDHRFETRLEYQGKLENGVLTGDLIIIGGGDPTLGSKHLGGQRDAFLATWVGLVKAAGIKRITGRVVADASLFDDQPLSPYWLWEDIGNYYAAGIYGLGIRDNSYTLHLKSGEAGTQPVILRVEPALPELQVENHLVAAANTKDSAYLYGQPYNWMRRLFGTMPANRVDFSIRGDLPDPPLQAARELHQALLKVGVRIQAAPTTRRAYPLPIGAELCVHTLGSVLSPPLSRIVAIIHEKSDNVYAEYLLRHLASRRFQPPYSAVQGLSVICDYWASKGLKINELNMVDGSGLSPVNRVSAHFVAELLTYMALKSQQATLFEASLPLAGVEGTVASFLADTPLAGQVRLKSGSNQTTTAYAGYYRREGVLWALVMLVNQTDLSPQKVRKDLTDFLLTR